MKKTLEQALTEQMAAEQRRVVSDWRALMLLRRATRQLPPGERRWSRAPADLEEIRAFLRRQVASGSFKEVEGVPHVYEAQAPAARAAMVTEDEVMMEARPRSALAYATALVFHGLTDDFPQETHIIEHSGLNPPGVREEDEEVLGLISASRVKRLFHHPVRAHRLAGGAALFGTAEYEPRGYPVRVTTPERTLLDGLLHPQWCGGFGKVLEAWQRAREALDVEALVSGVEQFDVAVLRQRAGFLMEQLKLEHPRMDRWSEQARRGGSSKLVGSEPFAPTYSERWKLSINVPLGALEEAMA